MTRCDVAVVGAGPAGMAAAALAAECGRRVCLLDDNPATGGQIWRGYEAAKTVDEPHGQQFAQWMRRVQAAGVELRCGVRVVAQPTAGVLRVESETGADDVAFDRLILATGARERFLPFPGWTLPGVMGAGGLQAMVKSGLPIAGKRVVLAGSGPLLLAVAAALRKRGARIGGIFEQAPLMKLMSFGVALLGQPGKLAEGLRYRAATIGAPYQTSAWVVEAHGDEQLRSVTVAIGRSRREIACDYLGCGFHLVANLELPRLLGCEIEQGYVRVDRLQQSSLPGIYCAGELTGIGGLEKALVEGEIAGLAAAGRSAEPLFAARDRQARLAQRLDAAFAPRAELRGVPRPDTLICRCEDVPRSALDGLRSAREARLHTRCGMGPCQGRVCGVAAEFLFGWEPASVRPPLTPALVSTLAAEPDEIATSVS